MQFQLVDKLKERQLLCDGKKNELLSQIEKIEVKIEFVLSLSLNSFILEFEMYFNRGPMD